MPHTQSAGPGLRPETVSCCRLLVVLPTFVFNSGLKLRLQPRKANQLSTILSRGSWEQQAGREMAVLHSYPVSAKTSSGLQILLLRFGSDEG